MQASVQKKMEKDECDSIGYKSERKLERDTI